MDLGKLAAHGRSPTRTAMVTDPIRRVLWWLISPYFSAAGNEIDGRIDGTERLLTTDFDDKLRSTTVSLRECLTATVQDSVRAAVVFQLAGVRKEITALAYRLAALEEEGGTAARARDASTDHLHSLSAQQNAFSDHLHSLSAQQNDTGSFLTALQNDFRSLATTLSERLDVATQANDKLEHEFHGAVQSLTKRVDGLVRGTPLHAGDRIAVGQGNLVITASPSGARFLLRQHDLIGDLVINGQEWEPHVRIAIERAARRDAIAIDAGAYIGLHTITMSRWFRTVHAFEPQRGIFQILCGNLALNGRTNVEAHNVALYDRSGSMRLAPQERQEVKTPVCDGQIDYDHIDNAAALSFDFVADSSGDVQAIALDDMSLDNVGLIKVDAQGADLRVLQGARETIRRSRPTVLFEWERDLGFQHGAILDNYHTFFETLEYDVVLLQETTPGRQADYMALPREGPRI